MRRRSTRRKSKRKSKRKIKVRTLKKKSKKKNPIPLHKMSDQQLQDFFRMGFFLKLSNFDKKYTMNKIIGYDVLEKFKILLNKIERKNLSSTSGYYFNQTNARMKFYDIQYLNLMRTYKDIELNMRKMYISHERFFSDLVSKQKEQVSKMEQKFLGKIQSLVRERVIELNEIVFRYENRIKDAKLINRLCDFQTRKKNSKEEESFGYNREFAMQNYKKEHNSKTQNIEIEIEKRVRRAHELHKLCSSEINRLHEMYLKKKKIEEESSYNVKEKYILIRKMVFLVYQWKSKWLKNISESEKRNKKLLLEKNELVRGIEKLRNTLQKYQKNRKLKLIKMIQTINFAEKNLKELIEMSTMIIRKHKLAQKIENNCGCRINTSTNECNLVLLNNDKRRKSLLDERVFTYFSEEEKTYRRKSLFDLNEFSKMDRFTSSTNKIRMNIEVLKRIKQLEIEKKLKLKNRLKLILSRRKPKTKDNLNINLNDLMRRKKVVLQKFSVRRLKPKRVITKIDRFFM